MNNESFEIVLNKALGRSKYVLGEKAKEYVRNGDRLHNFNRGAEISGESRERVLKGFMLKHLISVFDIIDDLDKGILPSRELVDEKLGDSINYMLLLEASLNDKIDNNGK